MKGDRIKYRPLESKMLVMKFIKRNVEMQDPDGIKKIFKCVFEKRKSPLLDVPNRELEVLVAVIINGRPVKAAGYDCFYHPDTGKFYTI